MLKKLTSEAHSFEGSGRISGRHFLTGRGLIFEQVDVGAFDQVLFLDA